MLFADLLSLCFLFLFMSLFLAADEYLSEFAIYYRVPSLPSEASYAVVAEESSTRPGFLQILSAHQLCISNSATLRNNYISFLICAHATRKEKMALQRKP